MGLYRGRGMQYWIFPRLFDLSFSVVSRHYRVHFAFPAAIRFRFLLWLTRPLPFAAAASPIPPVSLLPNRYQNFLCCILPFDCSGCVIAIFFGVGGCAVSLCSGHSGDTELKCGVGVTVCFSLIVASFVVSSTPIASGCYHKWSVCLLLLFAVHIVQQIYGFDFVCRLQSLALVL